MLNKKVHSPLIEKAVKELRPNAFSSEFFNVCHNN